MTTMKAKIKVHEQDLFILTKSMRDNLRIRPAQTKKFLQEYFQEQYDKLVAEGKDYGDITLQCPTPKMLAEWLEGRK